MSALSLTRKARLLQVTGIAAFILAWQTGTGEGWMNAFIESPTFWFSTPTAIGSLIWKLTLNGQLLHHVWLTMSATLIGLAIGAFAGTAIGIGMSLSTWLEQLFDPIWSALNALPKIALAPAFAAALGIGIASKAALAVTIVVFVFLFNTLAGLKSIDPVVRSNLRLMGASHWQMLKMLMLPQLARWHYGALRISLGLALTAVVVGEFVAARGGIGFIIQYGFGTFNVAWCYVGILVLGVLALALDGLLRWGQAKLSPWQAPQ